MKLRRQFPPTSCWCTVSCLTYIRIVPLLTKMLCIYCCRQFDERRHVGVIYPIRARVKQGRHRGSLGSSDSTPVKHGDLCCCLRM